MNPFVYLANRAQDLIDQLQKLDFLSSLALRAYLVPVFWVAGTHKLADMQSVAEWFGNPDWGLGLPAPMLMAWLATASEVGGAVLLTLGLAVRWITIPLMVTMVVAAVKVHWQNGWQAIVDPRSPFPPEYAAEALERLEKAKEILEEYGNYDWLTEYGRFVISNNGIEWAATYFVMLLALFFLGGGRYVSVDYWLRRRFRDR